MHAESAIHKVAESCDCHIRWWPVTSSKHVHALSRPFLIITANHLTSDPCNCFLSMPTVEMLKIEDQHRGAVRAETARLPLTQYNTAKDQ